MTKSIDLIAILRSGEHASAVWHVDVGPSTPLMRLCGAWVTNDTKVLSNVLASRAILPFGGKLDARAKRLAKAAIGTVDLRATLTAVRGSISELDEQHSASKTPAGKDRAPINWPDVPQPLDWVALPSAPAGVNPGPFISEVIVVAQWLVNLAEVWSKVQTARTSRGHLAAGDLAPRPLPIVLT